MNSLSAWYTMLLGSMRERMEELNEDESGISGMVVAIVLIVIALALAGIISQSLTNNANAVDEQLTSFVTGSGN